MTATILTAEQVEELRDDYAWWRDNEDGAPERIHAVTDALAIDALASHEALRARLEDLEAEHDATRCKLLTLADRMVPRHEHEALRARCERLERVADDWLAVMQADGYECTCADGDACPLCRCLGVLGRSVVAGEPSPFATVIDAKETP